MNIGNFIRELFGRKPRPTEPHDVSQPRSVVYREDVRPSEAFAPPTSARRIVLGFDFGTSCSKVVIGDPILQRQYLVPAVLSATTRATYLHAGVLYEDIHGGFHLTPAAGRKPHRNLKIRFLQKLGDASRKSARELREADLHAVLYTALVMAHARGWFQRTQGANYPDTEFSWSVNIGLPSRDATDAALVDAYERAAAAAWNLADSDVFTRERAAATLAAVGAAGTRRTVRAYPEVAAELETFRRSDFREYGTFLLIDVGAGTLDVSTFALRDGRETNDRVIFYATEVAHLGAFHLHEARLRSLADANLPQAATPLEEVDYTIPNEHAAYAGNHGVDHADVKFHLQNADTRFKRQCADVITKAVMATHVYLNRLGTGRRSPFRQEVPVFLCGGGARLGFYGDVVAETKNRLGRYLNWEGNPGLTRRRLADLKGLDAPGLAPEDFDRFAVAYGLSSPFRDLPRIHVQDLAVEVRLAKASPEQWNDTISIAQALRAYEELLYPPIPPDDLLPEIRLRRPVTIAQLCQTPLFADIPEHRIRLHFRNRIGSDVTATCPLPDEAVVDILRVNRHRPRFSR